MTDKLEIGGGVSPGFESVIDAFAANFAAGEELGACFAAYREGELVADIRAGWTDRDKNIPWTNETLAAIYSSGKAAMATLVAEAASAGLLDYEKPVAAYWPEFAANGKEAITLAMVLSHQAGLCGFPEEIPADEWIEHAKIAARLAAMAPLHRPGSASAYHPQTVGFIVNEIYRRATGATIGAALRLRGLDIFCGLSPAETLRVAHMTKPPSAPAHRTGSDLTKIAFLKPWSSAGKISREDWLAAEIPASNMHATAAALAATVHPLANGGVGVDGVRRINESTLRASLKIRISGEDLVLPFRLSWTAGLMANTNGHFGPSASAFGHAGFGGSAVMVDPVKKISAAYVMNKMSPSLAGDPRAVRLFTALDQSIPR